MVGRPRKASRPCSTGSSRPCVPGQKGSGDGRDAALPAPLALQSSIRRTDLAAMRALVVAAGSVRPADVSVSFGGWPRSPCGAVRVWRVGVTGSGFDDVLIVNAWAGRN